MRKPDQTGDSALIDPTAVVGRRVAGWLVDAAIIGGSVLVVLVLLGDSYQRPGPATDLDVQRFGDDIGVFFRSTVAVIHAWELAVAGAVALVVALLTLVVLPAWRGWSPGLLAADLRLVDRDGERVGARRALLRAGGWLIDILPGIPLVGILSMRFGRHHQRVGDRLAKTYVVDGSFTGRPPTDLAAVDHDGTVSPVDPVDHADGVEEDDDTEVASVRRRTRRRERKARAGDGPTVPDDTAAVDADQATASADDDAGWAPEPERAPATATAAALGGTPPAGDPAGDADAPDADESRIAAPTPGPPDGVTPDQPLWDKGHGCYVMWHGSTGVWVAYDDDDGAWKPIAGPPSG